MIDAIIELLPLTDEMPLLVIDDSAIISSNPLEFEHLITPIEAGVPLSAFLKKCGEICEQNPQRMVSLGSIIDAYKVISREYQYNLDPNDSIEDFFLKHAEQMKIFKPLESQENGITFSNLKKLLEAVKNTPTCKTITFNRDIAESPFITAFLNQNGFAKDDRNSNHFIRK